MLPQASEGTKNILSVIFSKNYETMSENSQFYLFLGWNNSNTKSKKNFLSKYPYKDLSSGMKKRNISEKRYNRGLTMTYSSRMQNMQESKYISKSHYNLPTVF